MAIGRERGGVEICAVCVWEEYYVPRGPEASDCPTKPALQDGDIPERLPLGQALTLGSWPQGIDWLII